MNKAELRAELREIHSRHAGAIVRMQVFYEVSVMGLEYIDVLPAVERQTGKAPGTSLEMLVKYAGGQEPEFFDLNAMVCIWIWSNLEAFIADYVLFCLRRIDSCRSQDRVRRVKGNLLEFLESDWDTRSEILLAALEAEIGSAKKQGVGRFQAVLECLGLGGGVHDAVRDELFTCSKYRNCLVHRDGFIDRRLAESVPIFAPMVGTRLGVQTRDLRRFLSSSNWFMLECLARVSQFICDDDVFLDSLRQEQAKNIAQIEKSGDDRHLRPFGLPRRRDKAKPPIDE